MSDKIDFTPPPDPLEAALTKSGVPTSNEEARQPVYKMLEGSKIPVSSKQGLVWKSRVARAKKLMRDLIDSWDENISYYNHDQNPHREGKGPEFANNRIRAKSLGSRHSSTENVVYSNVNAQIPIIYAKNPYVTFNSLVAGDTEQRETFDNRARALDKLVNALFGMTSAPGISLKPKARKAVLITLLTNMAWMEVGYTTKEKSSEQAMADLVDLSEKLSKTKEIEEIEEIEGALIALSEKIDFLSPSGPFVRLRMPHQVIVDPNASDPLLSDANWIAIEDMLPTDYINAIFAKEDEEKDEYKSIYEPTHILDCGEQTADDTFDQSSTSLFDAAKPYSAYGYENEESFNKAKMTKVCYIWDKTTRRVLLYNSKNWKWPIWVWDDPYKLLNFFPVRPLFFHDNPVNIYAKGEVSYYLDQQDQINTINSERNQALNWARRNIFYDIDSGLTPDDITRILSGPENTAKGIKIPDGKKIADIIYSVTPPSTNFANMFDKKDLYDSINRITAANEVARGGEFKTNTTNRAIEYYATMGNMRMDMRLDAIEDFIADIGWMIAQLCLRFMDPQTVKQITNIDVTEFWAPIDPLTDLSMLAVSCIGGSSQKQNKQVRKQEAIEIGQILAQFVKAAPGAVTKITLDMFSEIFDDINITEEDWETIKIEAQQMIDAAHGGAPGQGGEQAAPTDGPPQQTGGANPQQLAIMVTEALSSLPPNILKAIGSALAQGIPPKQILQELVGQLQSTSTH